MWWWVEPNQELSPHPVTCLNSLSGMGKTIRRAQARNTQDDSLISDEKKQSHKDCKGNHSPSPTSRLINHLLYEEIPTRKKPSRWYPHWASGSWQNWTNSSHQAAWCFQDGDHAGLYHLQNCKHWWKFNAEVENACGDGVLWDWEATEMVEDCTFCFKSEFREI